MVSYVGSARTKSEPRRWSRWEHKEYSKTGVINDSPARSRATCNPASINGSDHKNLVPLWRIEHQSMTTQVDCFQDRIPCTEMPNKSEYSKTTNASVSWQTWSDIVVQSSPSCIHFTVTILPWHLKEGATNFWWPIDQGIGSNTVGCRHPIVSNYLKTAYASPCWSNTSSQVLDLQPIWKDIHRLDIYDHAESGPSLERPRFHASPPSQIQN